MEVFDLLGKTELEKLIHDFERIEQGKGSGEGLTLREFVKVMRDALKMTPKLRGATDVELALLLEQAAKLFDEIDIDDEEWEA